MRFLVAAASAALVVLPARSADAWCDRARLELSCESVQIDSQGDIPQRVARELEQELESCGFGVRPIDPDIRFTLRELPATSEEESDGYYKGVYRARFTVEAWHGEEPIVQEPVRIVSRGDDISPRGARTLARRSAYPRLRAEIRRRIRGVLREHAFGAKIAAEPSGASLDISAPVARRGLALPHTIGCLQSGQEVIGAVKFEGYETLRIRESAVRDPKPVEYPLVRAAPTTEKDAGFHKDAGGQGGARGRVAGHEEPGLLGSIGAFLVSNWKWLVGGVITIAIPAAVKVREHRPRLVVTGVALLANHEGTSIARVSIRSTRQPAALAYSLTVKVALNGASGSEGENLMRHRVRDLAPGEDAEVDIAMAGRALPKHDRAEVTVSGRYFIVVPVTAKADVSVRRLADETE